MKKKNKLLMSISIISIVLLFTWYMFYIPKLKAVPIKNDNQIRVMSYNLKYGSFDLEEAKSRKDLLATQIINYQPDSIGIQEGDWYWMFDEGGLPAILLDYDYVGVGRDNGETSGEYAAIFYLKDKYEVLDSGTFWLSETPDEVSKGWDAKDYRICTWVTLKNKISGECYTHYNTHLDHKGTISRAESTKLLLEKIAANQTPFVLTGDFNYFEGSKNYRMLLASALVGDAKFEASDSMTHGTINWFTHINFQLFKPIDFCFVSNDTINVDTYRVDNSYWSNHRPVSDHYPIIVDFTFD